MILDLHPVPEWLKAELALNHSGIEIRWMPYGPNKVFVLPITGDAFYRMPVKKLNDHVMYRRYIHANSAEKWKIHPLTYFPDGDLVTDGRFVVFQKNIATGEPEKVFDCVNDDGSLHPLDRRVIDAIHLRDGKFGAHQKAIKDVEAAPERAEALALAQAEEATGDLFNRIRYDILKATPANACVTADPNEDELHHRDPLMPTQVTVLTRIRSLLQEGTARFFGDLEILGWFSDGAAQQQRAAIEMARSAGLLKRISHPFLKKYGRIAHINVVAGTNLYALPTDFLTEMHVTLMDASGTHERDCFDNTDADDWATETIPQLSPTYARPGYSFRLDETTQLPAIRVYAFGDGINLAAPGVLRLHYIREFTRITNYVAATAVDVDDPYCEGPQWYAVAQGNMKRGDDPSGYLALADRKYQDVFGSMAASAATGTKAQADGAAMTVKAGENRDSR